MKCETMMKSTFSSIRRALRAGVCLLLAAGSGAYANDAEIVLLIGKAEVQDSAQGPWRPATVQQKLTAGTAIRTSNASQLAVVMRDQTQIRLNEETLLRITGVAVDGSGTSVDVSRGRVWAQAKQYVSSFFRSVTAGVTATRRLTGAPLRMSTPTATVGIRGTDWELVVGDDQIGRAHV